jgi:hypothetical protein
MTHATKLFTVHELKVEDVDRDPDQPRSEMTGIEELAASMETFGQQHPILVRRTGNRYRIIGGERRWTARKMQGAETIYAYVAESDDAEVALLELVDNQHQPLTDAEKSRGAQRAFVYDVDVERIAAATGYGIDVVASAKSGYQRVNDPAATETMSFERLAAIDEFGDDPDALEKLLKAPEATWTYVRDNIARDRKRAVDVETAKRIIAEAGCVLLTDNRMNPEGYRYLERQSLNSKTKAPDGATAARIEAYGAVAITWYAPAGEDTQAAADAAEREAKDKLRAELAVAHENRIAFLAANFELDSGLKKLAEAAWENGTSASSQDLTGPLAEVRGFTARVTASLLADAEGDLKNALHIIGDQYNEKWTISARGESAVAFLDALVKAGYKPEGTEAERITILRALVKVVTAERKKKAKEAAAEAAAAGAEIASCETCWHNGNDCGGAEADCGECVDWTASEPDGDGDE